jgi:hypothetical protein
MGSKPAKVHCKQFYISSVLYMCLRYWVSKWLNYMLKRQFLLLFFFILFIICVDLYFFIQLAYEIRITVVVLNHNFLKYLIITIHLSKLILNCLTVFLSINPCQNLVVFPHTSRHHIWIDASTFKKTNKKSEKWNMICVHM